MHEPFVLAAIVSTFLLAGLVKGVIGLGLPTVVLGLLTAALDLTTAMELLIIPSLATNLYQANVGGSFRAILARIWPFILIASLMVWVGANALTRIELDVLSSLLGFLLISYAAISLAGIQFKIPARYEPWAGILFGALNGLLTGMTGVFLIPSVMYLQAIGFTRDMLIQAMGMLFTALTLSLAIALISNDFMVGNTIVTSSLLLIPALIGMFAGSILRRGLSETRFRLIFFSAILALGLYIVFQALF